MVRLASTIKATAQQKRVVSMNFTELVNAVITETNRPDMGLLSEGGDGRIPQQVAASTHTIHTIDGDYFFRDLQESQIVFDHSAYIQALDVSAFPRYRSFGYFRKNDPSAAAYQQNPTILPPMFSNNGYFVTTDTKLGFLTPLTPGQSILDSYGVEKTDVIYQAGSNLRIKSSTSLLYGLVGWWQFPNIDPSNEYANYSSWIAQDWPFSIVFHAASAILQKIGMTDAARKYDGPVDPRTGRAGLATEALNNLRKSNILMQGY